MNRHRRFLTQLVCTLLLTSMVDACDTPTVISDAGRPDAMIRFEADAGGGPQPESSTCEASDTRAMRIAALRDSFDALSTGVNANPTPELELPEDTTGTLQLGLSPHAFPFLQDDNGVRGAASSLGSGRIVAFSGQDFLSSQDRSTLLGIEGIDALIRNAVRWVSPRENADEAHIMVDNQAVADVLEASTFTRVTLAPVSSTSGLLNTRDWSAESLADVDVAIVQINEWGTLHISADQVATLKDFVRAGGGLILSGSAMHWSWWLNWSGERYLGELITEEAGIRWNLNSERNMRTAEVVFDAAQLADAIWCDYLAGETLSDAHMTQMAPLFQDARTLERPTEFSTALERMLRETPMLPVRSDNPAARLSADVAASLTAHAWTGPHAHPWASSFPGHPTTAAPDGEATVTIDATWSGPQPTGLYAPPGALIAIDLSEDIVDRNFAIQVGERYEDLRHIGHIETWERPPTLMQRTAIQSTQTTISNPFGGAIYLDVPTFSVGTVTLRVRGAIPMAVYTRGTSDLSAWNEALAQGAPQAILQEHGHVRLVVSAEAAQTITAPDDVLAFWTGFHQSHAALAQDPEERRSESHWVFDPQVGRGNSHHNEERIVFLQAAEAWALRTQTGDEDWWMFGRALGHQMRNGDWSGRHISQISANLFTMYTLNQYIHSGGDLETRGIDPAIVDAATLADVRWEGSNQNQRIQILRLLIAQFGWSAIRETFASYYSADFPRETYRNEIDGFAIRLSRVVERDLASFFAHWEYPMSEEASTTIRGLGYDAWLPTGWE